MTVIPFPTIDFPRTRAEMTCCICGGAKDKGCLVCWRCYREYDMRHNAPEIEAAVARHEKAIAIVAESIAANYLTAPTEAEAQVLFLKKVGGWSRATLVRQLRIVHLTPINPYDTDNMALTLWMEVGRHTWRKAHPATEATAAGAQYVFPGAEKKQKPNATQTELLF